MEYIENCVQQFRKERGITQEACADGVGVTRQTIIAIERGNYTPSITLALKLAAYFDVPVETLFAIKKKK